MYSIARCIIIRSCNIIRIDVCSQINQPSPIPLGHPCTGRSHFEGLERGAKKSVPVINGVSRRRNQKSSSINYIISLPQFNGNHSLYCIAINSDYVNLLSGTKPKMGKVPSSWAVRANFLK